MKPKEKLTQLKEATQSLALPYEDQIRLFPDFVLVTDELVLEYDEAFRCMNEFIDHKLITEQQAIAFEKINEYSQYLSDNFKDLFLNPDSLKKDSKWGKMRELAMEALQTMNWE